MLMRIIKQYALTLFWMFVMYIGDVLIATGALFTVSCISNKITLTQHGVNVITLWMFFIQIIMILVTIIRQK